MSKGDIIYGIDLGTSNSVVSVYDETTNSPKTVSPLIPSFVSLTEKRAGQEIKNLFAKGKTDNSYQSRFKINMTTSQSGRLSIAASTIVLMECKKYMKHSNKAVITVPAYFDFKQRAATKEAAQKAGIEVVTLINEPTAAALNCREDGLYAVFDLGGGTFDISVVDISDIEADVMYTDGYILGGDDLNAAIVADLQNKLNFKVYRSTPAINNALHPLAESIKLNIQKNRKSVTVDVSKLFPDTSMFSSTVYTLTTDEYKDMVKRVFGTSIFSIERAISSLHLEAEDIEIVLVGGSTYDPYLQELIFEKFPNSCKHELDKDKAVSYGAAIYGKLANEDKLDFISDLTKGVCLVTYNGNVELISPNSKCPCSNRILVSNSEKSNNITLTLVESDGTSYAELGDIVYELKEVEEAGKALVLVTVLVNEDGTLTLRGREALNSERKIQINFI